MVIENYNNDRDATVDSIGLNTKYAFNDNWGMEADLSWSKVERHDLRLESTAGNGTGSDPTLPPPTENISFTTDAERHHATSRRRSNYSDYGTVFLTDPGDWGGGPRRSGFVGAPDITDEIKAIRLSATRKFEGILLSDVSFGVNYADRTKAKQQFQSNLWLPRQHLACRSCRSNTAPASPTPRSSAARTASSATTRSAMWRRRLLAADQLGRRSECERRRSHQQRHEHLGGE